MKQELFGLYDIAECNLYDKTVDSKLTIPNIQRGLVWKSIQMELLWDSILRGFPIGAMLILQHDEKGEILDGQQRSNAIISGFNTSELLDDDVKVNTILWLDLLFKRTEEDEERRMFGIRLTNTSHPWGYDSLGGKLEAKDRRDSIHRAYGVKYLPKTEWDIRKFIPHYKKQNADFLPVPLAIYVNAAKGKKIERKEDIDRFWNQINNDIDLFSNLSENWSEEYKNKVVEFNDKHRNDYEFIKTFFQLNDYKIVFNYVESSDDIEILFNRVNRRGTQMTETELSYAAIKYYGEMLCRCSNIGEIIKNYSSGMMPEEHLAQILFRLCYSDNKIHGPISAGFIRKQALLEDSNESIGNLRYYFETDTELDRLLTSARNILLSSPDPSCQLPNFIIAEIATRNPDLFILLLNIIRQKNNNKNLNLSDQFTQALIFYLYCFSNCSEPIKIIYDVINKGNVSEEDVRHVLRDSISREWCDSLPSSFEDFPALANYEFTSSWNKAKYANCKGYSAFDKLFSYETYQGCFMLKYAQRMFYRNTFGDFNPSDKKYWDEINRPWDHDHMIPQKWIPKDGDWKNSISQWVNSMGNIADIPYEENRSKSDDPNWDYYDSNDKQLYYNASFKEITPQSFEQGNGIIFFMNIVKERFITISDDFLNLFTVLRLEDKLSPMQLERKKFCDWLQNKVFPDYDMFYRNNSGQEVKFDIDNIYAWQRPWLSLIKKGENKFAPAISIYALPESKTFILERGKRNIIMNSTSDSWWEEGTWFRRQVPMPLFEKEEISFIAKIFCYGDRYYSENAKANGFVLNSSSLLAYKTRVKGVDINAKIYESYGCFHCSIESNDSKTPLPDCVRNTDFDNGWSWNKNKTCVDCYLSCKNYDIKNVCDNFANLMIELSGLNNIQE